VDFADVKAVMTQMGMALMGIGYGRGERRAFDAATAAINSPLLDNMSVEGATGILINFTGGPDMRLGEINEAATMIMDTAHEDANIIFGSVVNPEMRDVIKVTVIATGFGRSVRQEEIKPTFASRIVTPPLAEQRTRPAQTPIASAPEVRSRPSQEVATRRSVTPSAPVSRETRQSGQFGIAQESDLDIPTFLRNRGGE
jgi:cell division protein FtsZ